MNLKLVSVVGGSVATLALLLGGLGVGVSSADIDGGQNVQQCGNISVGPGGTTTVTKPTTTTVTTVITTTKEADNEAEYKPEDSPNFVKCTQVPQVHNH